MHSNLETKYIVGVTGGIGSGKTTVTDLFAALGVAVVDADVVAREVVAIGTQGLHAVVKSFGKQVLLPNGELDRQQLRQIVFNDAGAKDTLNHILHPLIREKMLNQLQNTQSQYCILSAPLLLENNLQVLVDTVLVVDVLPAIQLQRTLLRDGSNEDTIKGIMAAQISREERLYKANELIDNNNEITGLPEQVNDLHKKYLQNSRLKLKQ